VTPGGCRADRHRPAIPCQALGMALLRRSAGLVSGLQGAHSCRWR
jgi:hypothetical protein